MTSKISPWRQQVCHDVRNMSWWQKLRQKDVMMSKIYHKIKNTSWRKNVCHNVKSVVVLAVLPSLAPPSGEVGLECKGSLLERDAELVLMSDFFSDTGAELEDELCHFQPLPETVSPLSASSVADLPMSPSRYPVLAVPEVACADSATRVSPTPIREVHSLRTMDVFPMYEMSPDVSYYEPATSPVTPALPVDSDYVSPGGSGVNR